jgi:hypothetical protein
VLYSLIEQEAQYFSDRCNSVPFVVKERMEKPEAVKVQEPSAPVGTATAAAAATAQPSGSNPSAAPTVVPTDATSNPAVAAVMKSFRQLYSSISNAEMVRCSTRCLQFLHDANFTTLSWHLEFLRKESQARCLCLAGCYHRCNLH